MLDGKQAVNDLKWINYSENIYLKTAQPVLDKK
jgi:hypothetical protein